MGFPSQDALEMGGLEKGVRSPFLHYPNMKHPGLNRRKRDLTPFSKAAKDAQQKTPRRLKGDKSN